jgi:antitoxin component YwqK of YwqJK toxin-antitoxin module
VLECKAKDKGRVVKVGPAVVCKEGQGQAFGEWKVGKKHGRHVTMRPDGSWLEEDFADGKLEGRQVEYSAEGQLLKDTHYQAGKKHGPARVYGEDGKLASEELWDKGVKGKKPGVAKSPAEGEPEGEATTPAP